MASTKKKIENTRVEKRRKLKIFNILSTIFAIISLISLGIFSYVLLNTKVVPSKYLGIIYLSILVVYFIMYLIFFKKKCPKTLKIVTYVISFIISVIFIVGSFYLGGLNKFFNNIKLSEYDTISYSVIVLNDSEYNKISDLENKSIGYLDENNKNKVTKKLQKKISYKETIDTSSTSLATNLLDDKIDAICLEQGYIAMLSEEIGDFEKKTKVIYTFEIKIKAHKEEEKQVDASKDSFIIYISGIDQYGNVNSVRGRSDVNQLALVNPTTHKILLLNTPRDYYVQLSGTTGLKDKLTHAGIYGIDKSIATLEELYDIDINYYFRVNFDTLIKMVDTVGGIDVYSDTDLTLLHDKSYHVKVGMNKLNGKQALAYARERFGYTQGDRHRGENQQAIIKALISKMTDSKVLLSKYNDILNTLGSSFQTDMSSDTITEFLKKQLDDMSGWTVETYSVDGSGSKQPTYSMGSKRPLYVMIPDEKTVDVAKIKIKEVIEGK